MDEPWDEVMGPPDEGNQASATLQTQRLASRDPPGPVIRSATPSAAPPPASMFRSSLPGDAVGTSQRWSQYEADVDDDSTRAATSQAVYLASNAALSRSESQRSRSAFADEDMEVEADDRASTASSDMYMRHFEVSSQRSNNVSFDEDDDDEKSVDSAIGREYDARNHDHIRQEALRMLEVADADTHYSVHRTITGGFTAQPKPLGNQRRTRTALQGLNFVANSRAKNTNRYGNYSNFGSATSGSAPTREDFEYGEVDSVVDVIGLENRSAATAAADSQSSKSWSSRYSIDSTMLAMSGGAMKQKLDRMDQEHTRSMDRFSASNLFRNSPAKAPQIFGSGFDFRQQHIFGKQKVTIPTDNLQPAWNDDTESPTPRARTWQEQLFYKKQQQRRWLIGIVIALLCLIVPLVSILSVRRTRRVNRSSSAAASSAIGFPSTHGSTPESDSGGPVSFFVTANSPHDAEQEAKLKNDFAAVSKFASFAVHLGNIQDPNVTNCTDEAYVRVADLLEDTSPVRVFVVPGGEDWNNCPYPDDAWDSWDSSFRDFDDKWNTVPNAKDVTVMREKHILENWAFVEQGVLFMGVHVVNGQVPDSDEFEKRNRLNYEWVMGMSMEYRDKVRALVVFGNAPPGQEQNKKFFYRMKQYLTSYPHPTLYVHAWSGKEATEQYQLFADVPHVTATGLKNDLKSKPLRITVGLGDKPFAIV